VKANLIHRHDAAQATENRSAGTVSDERVYVNLHQLTLLQHQARGISFLPRQPVHSLLSGRHASRVRGRGLNFEEIRQYHAGDDVRTIDWKVTARLRSPHTRVYTEERDRPVLLVVDQRIGMFFGTQVNMKSVTAAQTAAMAAWRILDAKDRVGAIVFNDDDIEVIRPNRSRDTVMRILKTIVNYNQKLSADTPSRPNPNMLEQVIQQTSRIATHDFLVTIISDFHGYNETVLRYLRRIRQHNDMIAALVHDPSASKLRSSRDFVVTDGELQVELKLAGKQTRERIQETTSGRMATVLELQNKLQTPVFPLSTAEDVAQQLHRLLGRSGQITQQSGRG
jgi:uncharacterized protein (DUF58 family)